MDVCSADWELKQQALAAEKRTLNSAHEVVRDYRLVALTSGDIERTFYAQVDALLEYPTLWQLMPTESLTRETLVTCFITLDKHAGIVENILARPHRGPPYLTLRSAVDAGAREQILAAEPHSLDP